MIDKNEDRVGWRAGISETGEPLLIRKYDPVRSHLGEKHWTIPELSERWGYSEDVIRRWFLDKPRPGVLRQSERRRGKREYISLRVSESAAAAVYAEKCNVSER